MRTYDLFISHAWSYDERYEGVVRLLNFDQRFWWRDYSAPQDRPLVDPDHPVGKRILKEKIDEQIRQCTCFILIAGMFVYHREWVQFEMKTACNYGKPIVGVRRRGQQRTPTEVEEIAHVMVNWNSASLIAGIKEACALREREWR